MDHCTYCGSCDDIQRDHVIPNSFLRLHRAYAGDWLVPACGECNRNLGDELFFNVPDRARHLVRKFARKWRKHLDCPVTVDDVEQATGNFRRYLEAAMALRLSYQRRMQHLVRVAELPPTWRAELCPWFAEVMDDEKDHATWRKRALAPFMTRARRKAR